MRKKIKLYLLVGLNYFLGSKSKIIAPPATLTAEMGRNLSSAKSEVQMVGMIICHLEN